MSKFRNHVQLIGNIGEDPKITNLDNGKKVARFLMATNERYKNAKGESVQNTDWHTVVAWGRTAEIVEKYAAKGREVGVTGKLRSRHFETKEGTMRYVTEVVANEILLLGSSS
jgi:single-strand DNA-binding protein|tara:strand:+ start:244 stop:582 length:339 start_codon:yes stop_codon:yes gene_type:complete